MNPQDTSADSPIAQVVRLKLAGDVHLAHRAQLSLGELAVLDAKAGVLVG